MQLEFVTQQNLKNSCPIGDKTECKAFCVDHYQNQMVELGINLNEKEI